MTLGAFLIGLIFLLLVLGLALLLAWCVGALARALRLPPALDLVLRGAAAILLIVVLARALPGSVAP